MSTKKTAVKKVARKRPTKKVAVKRRARDPSKKEEAMRSELLNTKLRNVYLESRVKDLEVEAKKGNRLKDTIDINIGDPEPIDAEKRRQYVGVVAGLHNEVLKPKLQKMISNAFKLLEASENHRDIDQALKGTIYAFRELITWGDLMISEDASYRSGENPDKDN